MNLLVPEILDQVDKAKTKAEKIQLLKKYETPVLKTLLRLNFDPLLKMDLPDGEPPFKKEPDKPIGYSESNLITEYRRFYIWLTPQPGLSKIKKETLFIEMLEALHITEAEVLCLAKDRKLHTKFKSIKEDLVREAYPKAITPKEVIAKLKEEGKL